MLFGLVPLANGILEGSENITMQPRETAYIRNI